jgi:acyl carrier protein
MSARGESWLEFRAAIADACRLPAEDIGREMMLIGDLGLDSLALSELALVLIVDLHMVSIADGLEECRWESLSVGSLYDQWLREVPPSAR